MIDRSLRILSSILTYRLTLSLYRHSSQSNRSKTFEQESISSISSLKCRATIFFGKRKIEIPWFSEGQKFTESRIGVPASNESVQNKFQFILEYLSSRSDFFSWVNFSGCRIEQCTSPISEWNVNDLIRGNDILLCKVILRISLERIQVRMIF